MRFCNDFQRQGFSSLLMAVLRSANNPMFHPEAVAQADFLVCPVNSCQNLQCCFWPTPDRERVGKLMLNRKRELVFTKCLSHPRDIPELKRSLMPGYGTQGDQGRTSLPTAVISLLAAQTLMVTHFDDKEHRRFLYSNNGIFF